MNVQVRPHVTITQRHIEDYALIGDCVPRSAALRK